VTSAEPEPASSGHQLTSFSALEVIPSGHQGSDCLSLAFILGSHTAACASRPSSGRRLQPLTTKPHTSHQHKHLCRFHKKKGSPQLPHSFKDPNLYNYNPRPCNRILLGQVRHIYVGYVSPKMTESTTHPASNTKTPQWHRS
jgi:hypothetical protein